MTPEAAAAHEPDDAYGRWVRSGDYRAERPEKADVIARVCGERLRGAGRVGDLGAGTGIIKNTLEAITGKPIVGFELDRSFVERKERLAVADVLRLPAPDAAFDFLIMNHLYEHVGGDAEQRRLFREAYRVLRPGGAAYVSAGNRLAVMEPHFRLPFLSWLPRSAADAYLRLTGRGRAYHGIRFRTYGPLRSMMAAPGFRVRDETERALRELLGEGRGRAWLPAWRALRAVPAGARRRLLHWLSPQWFFLLEKPGAAAVRRDPGAPADARAPAGREGGDVGRVTERGRERGREAR